MGVASGSLCQLAIGPDTLPLPRAEVEPILWRGKDACAPRPNDFAARRKSWAYHSRCQRKNRRHLPESPAAAAAAAPLPLLRSRRAARLDLLGHHACRGTTTWAGHDEVISSTQSFISAAPEAGRKAVHSGTAAARVVKGRHVRASLSETADASYSYSPECAAGQDVWTPGLYCQQHTVFLLFPSAINRGCVLRYRVLSGSKRPAAVAGLWSRQT
ncbi:hypothetical protein SEVIR_5G261701v4 [Setaria viridis]